MRNNRKNSARRERRNKKASSLPTDPIVELSEHTVADGIQTHEASSIPKALKKATRIIAGWTPKNVPPYCWYRGATNDQYLLTPKAYREPFVSSQCEVDPLIELCQDGGVFADVRSVDDWHTYYFAQHFGIPTRLLDWTESFLAAVFFALDGWDGSTTPCVWITQPYKLNKVFLGWEGTVSPESMTEMNSWLPKQIAKRDYIISTEVDHLDEVYVYDNRWPVAIFPKKSNQRIVAQQGAFTIHGRKPESLALLVAEKLGEIPTFFAKILLKDFDKEDAIRDLKMLGVKRSSVYPDIENFVKQLQENYKWR